MDLAERDKIFKLIARNATSAAWSLASMEFLRLAIAAGLIKLDDDNRPLEADHVSAMARTLASRIGAVRPGTYQGRLGLRRVATSDDSGNPSAVMLAVLIEAPPDSLTQPELIQPETPGAVQLVGLIDSRARAEELLEGLHDATNDTFPESE